MYIPFRIMLRYYSKEDNSVSLKEDLEKAATEIIRTDMWSSSDGRLVPSPEDLALGNDAIKLDAATVLYADMADSTKLVDNYPAHFAAELYKTYMVCAARIIKDRDGTITAYDGDRIMGVFVGESQHNDAAKAALKINWAVSKIINPTVKKQYGDGAYQMRHVIGIDTSPLFACRIGVRNDNDIVWVGRAANYAAKLSALNEEGYSIYITGSVFDGMDNSAKLGGNPLQLMWEDRQWPSMNNMRVYRSGWIWPV
jgi:uridylate cyclase